MCYDRQMKEAESEATPPGGKRNSSPGRQAKLLPREANAFSNWNIRECCSDSLKQTLEAYTKG